MNKIQTKINTPNSSDQDQERDFSYRNQDKNKTLVQTHVFSDTAIIARYL